jgi:hypothetical protein
MSSIGIIKIFF